MTIKKYGDKLNHKSEHPRGFDYKSSALSSLVIFLLVSIVFIGIEAALHSIWSLKSLSVGPRIAIAVAGIALAGLGFVISSSLRLRDKKPAEFGIGLLLVLIAYFILFQPLISKIKNTMIPIGRGIVDYMPVQFEFLAMYLPDDTAGFVSVDTRNTSVFFKSHMDAGGNKRLQEFLDKFHSNGNIEGDIKKVMLFSKDWLGREVLIAFGDYATETALLIGSQNMEQAELKMPDIVGPAVNIFASALKGFAPESADKLMSSIADGFSRISEYKGLKIQCAGSAGGESLSNPTAPCWTSAPRAVIVASNREYLVKIIDSSFRQRTERQMFFRSVTKLGNKGQLLAGFFDINRMNARKKDTQYKGIDSLLGLSDIAGTKADEKADKKQDHDMAAELAALRGLQFSLDYDEKSVHTNFTILIDGEKAKNTEIFSKLSRMKSAPHKIDYLLNVKGAAAYLSVNNFSDMLALLAIWNPRGYNEIRANISKNIQANLDELLDAFGGEMGLALLDLNMVNNDDRIDFIALVELDTAKNGKDIILKFLRKAVAKNAGRGGVSMKQTAENIYEISIKGLPTYMKPCFGFTDRFMYFSLSPDKLKEFLSKAPGAFSGKSSILSFSANPDKAETFTKEWFRRGREKAKNAEAENSLTKYEEDKNSALEGLLAGLIETLGPVSVSIGSIDGGISADISAGVSKKGLAGFPYERALTTWLEKKKESGFYSCYKTLFIAGYAMFQYNRKTGGYNGVDQAGDAIAGYLFGNDCSSGECKGRVAALADGSCQKGTFSVEIPEPQVFYLKARSPGTDCTICVGPFGMTNYHTYEECVSDPSKGCDRLGYGE